MKIRAFLKKLSSSQKLAFYSLCLTIIILVIAGYFKNQKDIKPIALRHIGKMLLVVFYFGWLLLPPIWFLWEYHKKKYFRPGEFEHFKYSQELASKFWAAILIALFIIFKYYFHIESIDK